MFRRRSSDKPPSYMVSPVALSHCFFPPDMREKECNFSCAALGKIAQGSQLPVESIWRRGIQIGELALLSGSGIIPRRLEVSARPGQGGQGDGLEAANK